MLFKLDRMVLLLWKPTRGSFLSIFQKLGPWGTHLVQIGGQELKLEAIVRELRVVLVLKFIPFLKEFILLCVFVCIGISSKPRTPEVLDDFPVEGKSVTCDRDLNLVFCFTIHVQLWHYYF